MTVEESGAGVIAAGSADPGAPGYLDAQVAVSAAGTLVCRIAGDLDLGSVATARAALERAVGSGEPLVVVDLAGVGFCDSAGLNLLLQVRLDAERAGVELQLSALSSPVARVFELTGALELFRVRATTDEAERD